MASSSRASSTAAEDSCSKRKRVDNASDSEVGCQQQGDVDITFKRPKLAQTRRLLRNDNGKKNQQQIKSTNASDDENDYEERERKKRKKGRSRNQGKLSVFLGLPLDVLAEITSYLFPLDVLHLSRVSKNFRELFNPHASRHMWVAARLNILPSLPECPKDLNEAQYASLMFEHQCQACASQRAHIVDFSLRCRTCKPCYEELTGVGYDIVDSIHGANDALEVLYSLSPFSTHKDPYDDFSYASSSHRFNIAELTAVVQQYIKLEGNQELRKKFVQERQETTRMMLETSQDMENWLATSRRHQHKKNEDTASNRHAEIVKRLLELGWTHKDIDDNSNDGEMKKMMYQPRPLTIRIWKQIYPKIQKILIATRLISRRREFKASWGPVVDKLVPAEQRIFIPNASEALHLSSIVTLLNHDNAGNPVDELTIEEVMPQALKEAEPHQIMVKRCLLKAIYEAEKQPPLDGQKSALQDDDTISLDDPRLFYACHRFQCGRCHFYGGLGPKTFHFLELYDHFKKSHASDVLVLDHFSWTVSRVLYASSTAQYTKEILKVIGLAENARQEELVPFEGKLACTCGSPSAKGKRFELSSLTAHIRDENHLYDLVMYGCQSKDKESRKLKDEEMEIHDDHAISNFKNLIAVIPDDEEPSELDHENNSNPRPSEPETAKGAFEKVKCVPCCVLTDRSNCIRHFMESHDEVEYHLKAKHGLDFKEHYVSTKLYSYEW